MRKEIASAVKKLFDAGMKRKLAQFQLFKNKGNREIKPGTQVYRWESAPDLYFFIMLEIQAKEPDRFWISLGWSRDGLVPSVYPELKGEVGARFNLGKLWNARNSFHYWELTKVVERVSMSDDEMIFALSDAGEEQRIAKGISQAPASVDDAIERIVQYAVPYFDSILHVDLKAGK
jgi:hypothetical protein